MNMLFRTAINVQGKSLHAQYLKTFADPEDTQNRVLAAILAQNARTAFGRDHGLATGMSMHDFRSAVPIRSYETLTKYTTRLLAGEKYILSRESPRHFATTSGTTGVPKYIPVTARWRRELTRLNRLWMYLTYRDNPQCFRHGTLMIIGGAIEGYTTAGVPYGAMSGLAYERLSRVAGKGFIFPYALTQIPDMRLRYFLTMRFALARRVSSIVTANPTTLLRLAETAQSYADELLRAINDGTLGPDKEIASHLDRNIHDSLLKRCVPDRARARFLERCIETHGTLRPRDAWPELQLLGCWLGGSAGRHAALLDAAYGSVNRRDLGLLASEGRFSLTLANNTATGVLTTASNFYDFVDEDVEDASSAPAYLAHELQEGKRYRVIVTSMNGLWRYDINDVVQVSGFTGRTPMITFARKGRDVVSIVGEKLHVNQLHAAMEILERVLGCSIVQYRCIPDAASFRHDILIECAQAITANGDLAGALDSAIANLNEEYASKRHSERLKSPRIFFMRPGWSEEQTLRDVASGKRETQYKWAAVKDEWDDLSRASIMEAYSQC